MGESNSSRSSSGASGPPSDASSWIFEGFEGINSKPSRLAIGDKEMSWCKNLMPLGEDNLRAIPDKATNPIYTSSVGRTILSFYSFSILTTKYVLIFLDDGSGAIIQTNGTPVTTFAAATFPIGSSLAQWGSKFIIIVGPSSNGFFVWDGTTLYKAGTLGPIPDLLNVGSGYSSAPTVSVYGGSGTGATVTAQIVGDQVSQLTVTNPGSGYTLYDVAALAFTGGGSGATSAVIVASVSGGLVTALTITAAGAGYTSEAKPVFVGGGGIGAEATLYVQGSIGSVQVVDPGAGYTGPPAVAITGAGGSGTGAAATAVIFGGALQSIFVTTPGSGYQTPVDVALSGGGATRQGTAQATVVDASIIGYNLTNSGNGYVAAPTVYVDDPLATVPQATITPMPFGIQGTTVEVFQSRVWVGNGTNIYFTSPDNPTDFDVGNGAGAFPITDSFLIQSVVALKALQGLLYVIGDSSANYISGVTTSGNPPTTTFTYLNIDREVGSPWRDAVVAYSRSIMLPNSVGIHALYGGAVEKVSTPMDGIFFNSNSLFPISNLSAAIADLFGVRVFVFLSQIFDPVTNALGPHLTLWDGKRWWVADQSLSLTFIQTFETSSIIKCFGTDGTTIYQLMLVPSNATAKEVQSKLWSRPSYLMTKRITRFAGMYYNYSSSESLTISVTLDNEVAPGATTYSQVFPYVGTGAYTQVQNGNSSGVALGFTLSSTNKDFSIVSFTALGQDYKWNV